MNEGSRAEVVEGLTSHWLLLTLKNSVTHFWKFFLGSNELWCRFTFKSIRNYLHWSTRPSSLWPRDAHRSHALPYTQKTALKFDFWGCGLIRSKHTWKNVFFNLLSQYCSPIWIKAPPWIQIIKNCNFFSTFFFGPEEFNHCRRLLL